VPILQSYTAQVINGMIVLDEDKPLPPDGTRLRVEVIAESTGSRRRTLAERIASVIGRAEGLPTDLADQQDHYLHGQPKR
jgi:hypothetical protein